MIQENSYYAFGLVMTGGITPTDPNKNLYNGGSEWQNDFGDLPDLMQTYYRNYDQALGRWTGVDPDAEGAESLTTYNYSGNNPVMYNDPLGNLLLRNPASDRHEAWLQGNSVFDANGLVDFDRINNVGGGSSGGGFSNWGGFWGVVGQLSSSQYGGTSTGVGHTFEFNSSLSALRYGFSQMPEFDSIDHPGWATSYSQALDNFNGLSGQPPIYDFGANWTTIGGWWHDANGKAQVYNGVSAEFDIIWVGRGSQPAIHPATANPYMFKDEDIRSFWANVAMGLTAEIGGEFIGAALKGTNTARVFWSGGKVAKSAAARFAAETGMTTLEMTPKGRIMNAVSPYLPRFISNPIWNNLSRNFAEGAIGDAHFFTAPGARVNSIWSIVERPILEKNGINIFVH